jgi:phytoene dehydrogenase-like protein
VGHRLGYQPKRAPVSSAIVIGSGPNGLAAAITLAQAGVNVSVAEAAEAIGGGLRTSELTLPGLLHDHCAAIVASAVGSPFIQSLDLAKHGVEWAWPDVELAHPLDDGTAGVLHRSLHATCKAFGADERAWHLLFDRPTRDYDRLAPDIWAPLLKIPRHPLLLARFGIPGMLPATAVARLLTTPQARALFAGNAAHAWTPLSRPPTSAVALMFGAVAHRHGWPCVVGGSGRLADGLASVVRSLGGCIETATPINSGAQLRGYNYVLFDTGPALPLKLLGHQLPPRVRRALQRYRYGSAAFKLDIAVHGEVPWTNRDVRKAGTVHVCGSYEEVVAAERDTFAGRMPKRPFVIVAQQALMDPSRAAGGLVPIYAYAHVPHGYSGDASTLIIEQIERFAPGFRERVAAVHTATPADFAAANPNNVGGDINGGALDFAAFVARPRLSLDPYWLGIAGHYLCSSSTPPGTGVHGMCGHLAARSALKRHESECRSWVA